MTAALMAVALRAVRRESRVSFILKLDFGDGFSSEDLFEKSLIFLDDLCFLP